jgi:hypothetical protein
MMRRGLIAASAALALFTFGCGEKVDDKCPEGDCVETDAGPPDPVETDAGPPQPGEWTPEPNATLRVLVAYASDAWTYLTGLGYDPIALALARIEVTNLVLSNSGVSHRAELADAVAMVTAQTDIEVADECSGGLFGPECGSQWLANQLRDSGSELTALRAAAEADVVMLIFDHSLDPWAGMATAIPGNSESAQIAGAALVYYDELTFPHELGHVLGADHDRSQFSSGDTLPGIGFGFTAQSIEAYTLMAYSEQCVDVGGTTCTRVPWFSTPEAQISGVPLGDAATEFNACVVEHYGSEVSSYYEMISGVVPVATAEEILSCPYTLPDTFDAGGDLCVGEFVISSDVDLLAIVSQCGTIRGSLTVDDGVTTLAPLEQLVVVEGALMIRSSTLTSLAGLEALRYAEILTIESPVTTLSPLSAFRQAGTLTVAGAAITDLDGLQGLVLVRSLSIRNCDSLTSLAGLEGVTSIEATLSIEDCDALDSLAGLESLAHLGTLRLAGDDSLSTLAHLSALESLEALTLEDLPSLTTIDAFDAITEIGDDVVVRDCAALEDLAGLASLTRIGHTLTVANLDALDELTGLEALREVGDAVAIRDNAVLATLSGLASLETTGAILLQSNPNLDDCTLPSLLWVDAVINTGNGAGCVL